MSDILYDEVPSLDLADFTSGNATQRQQFVDDLGNAYQNIGFVAIKNHGLSDGLVQSLYTAIQDFFSLPEDVKRSYEDPELAGQRGYVSKGKERAKGRKTGDLKEFYHVGQTVSDNDPISAEYPDNIWPDVIEEFEAVGQEVYSTFENTGRNLLRATALYLGLEETYFDAKIHNGNSILRLLHYYPVADKSQIPEGAVRAAAHGDINLITLWSMHCDPYGAK
jgi:isopenicillin N synthase-like dioxygenase